MSIYAVISDGNFDLLIKALSATFLKCKITNFFFVIGKYFAG